MQSKNILIFVIILSFVAVVTLSNVNAISPFTEIGNLEQETLEAFNDLIDDINAEIVRINSLNSTQIVEHDEQDLIQTDVINLQGNATTLKTTVDNHHFESDITDLRGNQTDLIMEVKSIMTSLNTIIRDHPAAFNVGSGQNGTITTVVLHKAFVNTNVTNTYGYLESNRNFNNGTAKSFQLADDVLLLGDSKIFLDTHIVPLGVTFDGSLGLVNSCLILPTEDPNICARTTALEAGEELRVLFKTDLGGVLTGLNSNIVTTRITTVITP